MRTTRTVIFIALACILVGQVALASGSLVRKADEGDISKCTFDATLPVSQRFKSVATCLLNNNASAYDREPSGQTHCNKFAADYLGVVLPSEAAEFRDKSSTRQYQYLSEGHGWSRVSHWLGEPTSMRIAEVQGRANEGNLVVAAEPGHIAIVLPTDEDESTQSCQLYVAQAGKTVGDHVQLHGSADSAFSNADLTKNVDFFYKMP